MTKHAWLLMVLTLLIGCAKPADEPQESETSGDAPAAVQTGALDQPADSATEKPEGKPEDKPADKPEDKPADKPSDEPAAAAPRADEEGWYVLFDGTSLDGWEANENPESWRLEDGILISNGQPRSHLFYVGPVNGGTFKNFELKVEAMTEPGANSGVYFHTQMEPTGWPSKGYEVQINNTHRDPKKTGGLYAIADNFEAPVEDGEWFTQHIVVRGKHVQVWVNDKQIVDYTEEDNPERPANMANRLIDRGTFALQGHDPQSVVHFRKILVKPLPDDL